MPAIEKPTLEASWLWQREKAVAWLRFIFALVAVAAIQLNQDRVERFPTLSMTVLWSFLLYSFIVLQLTRRHNLGSAALGVVSTLLDVVWIGLIVFSTGGTRTPFFTYYSFPVITASLRWGLTGSIPVALVGVVMYVIIRLTLAAEAELMPIGIDTILVRSFYLLLLAGIFGFISEFEKKQNQRLLALSKTAGQAATLQERRRIMFELHDGILQSLATVILRLEGCREQIANSQQDVTGEIRSIEDLARDSMKQIRLFLSGQDTQPLVAGTLLEKLREEARFLHEGMGLDVILESEPEEINLPPETEREVYYVLREALTNVTRHSHASNVEIHLIQQNGSLKGSLADNGVGFNREKNAPDNRLGLMGMEQRIKKIGGEFFVKSSPGKGTQVSFDLRIAAPSETAS
jgi:two-component system, NarL family, sensor histidine kinase YdfH